MLILTKVMFEQYSSPTTVGRLRSQLYNTSNTSYATPATPAPKCIPTIFHIPNQFLSPFLGLASLFAPQNTPEMMFRVCFCYLALLFLCQQPKNFFILALAKQHAESAMIQEAEKQTLLSNLIRAQRSDLFETVAYSITQCAFVLITHHCSMLLLLLLNKAPKMVWCSFELG